VSAPDPLRLGPVPAPIQRAYDSERFRADGHRLVDALADLLAAAHARAGRVLPWQAPAAGRAAIPDLVGAGADGGHDAIADLAALAAGSIQLHHPHAVGHQVAPPLPVAALAELVAATVNNGMAVYEMGPTAVPVEDVVIDWMLAQAGLPTRAHGGGGVLTSGGSLGNLTALLAARQASVARAAATGADPAAAPTLLSAAEAHYSVARAVAVMGWGAAGLTLVGTDRARRLDPDLTRRAGLAARADGRRLVALVASAGSTATGAFDPLDELADVAAELGCWLHVDGAHGASLALSAQHRHLVRGLHRADSVVWDAHKLLMMPALVTAVLLARRGDGYRALSQDASYLYAADRGDDEWWNPGLRTLECTKRAMSFELYAALRAHGAPVLASIVDRLIAAGAALAGQVAADPRFELLQAPEANIVCFRHRPAAALGPDALDHHNAALRQRMLEDGRFYLVTTRVDGRLWLRCALMNPLVEDHDLADLLAAVAAAA
jgi:L-2,4-diaminobutyrate decarboxylase